MPIKQLVIPKRIEYPVIIIIIIIIITIIYNSFISAYPLNGSSSAQLR